MQLEADSNPPSATMFAYIDPVTPFAANVAKWLVWVVMDDLPFSFVERERTRQNTTLENISVKTLMKYFHLLVAKTRDILKRILPGHFGIVYDGWSIGSEHYLALFAVWSQGKIVHKQLLSCFVQDDLDEETEYLQGVDINEQVFGLTAEDQYDCIYGTLLDYGFSAEDLEHKECLIEFFCGDNCSTNVKMAKKANIPFVGCKSHLLNLDVQEYIGKEAKVGKKRNVPDTPADPLRELVNRVDKLSGKLRTIKNSAVLRQAGITETPQRKNATRWASLHACLRLILIIVPKLTPAMNFGKDEAEINNLTPSRPEQLLLKTLMETLDKFESISKALQTDSLTLSQADQLLAQLSVDVDKTMHHIDPKYCDSPCYHMNYDFYQGVCKVQRGQEAQLTPREKDAIKIFLKPVNHPTASNTQLGYADRILSNLSETIGAAQSAYHSTDHVLPTSNIVERLFSMCKRTMSDLRKHMGPETLEGSVLLRVNSNLWLHDASKLIQEIINEEAADARAVREARNAVSSIDEELSQITDNSST